MTTMTHMTSGNLLSETPSPLKALADYLVAFFKAPTDAVRHYRTTQEERDLRNELRMLGGS
jgi:hypothetical protein